MVFPFLFFSSLPLYYSGLTSTPLLPSSSFGPKAISLKPILQLLPKIFSHADKTVRSEGSLLCLTLYSYLGSSGLSPHLSELKPVQVKELQESFEKSDRGEIEGYGGYQKLKPTRFTWTVKRDSKVREAEGALSGGGLNEEIHVAQPGEVEEEQGECRTRKRNLFSTK
jgi:cytoskeleton-associated protein 5